MSVYGARAALFHAAYTLQINAVAMQRDCEHHPSFDWPASMQTGLIANLACYPAYPFREWDWATGMPDCKPVWTAENVPGTYGYVDCNPYYGTVHEVNQAAYVGVKIVLDAQGQPTGDVTLYAMVWARGMWWDHVDAPYQGIGGPTYGACGYYCPTPGKCSCMDSGRPYSKYPFQERDETCWDCTDFQGSGLDHYVKAVINLGEYTGPDMLLGTRSVFSGAGNWPAGRIGNKPLIDSSSTFTIGAAA